MTRINGLDRNARVYVAGHRGLAGSAIWRALSAAGFTDLVGARSSEVDLRDRAATCSLEHVCNVPEDAEAHDEDREQNLCQPALGAASKGVEHRE